MYNNIFTDCGSEEELLSWSVEEKRVERPDEWLVGWYDAPRTGELPGPQAGDVTEMTTRYLTQKAKRPLNGRTAKRPVSMKLSEKAAQLDAAAAKKRRMY